MSKAAALKVVFFASAIGLMTASYATAQDYAPPGGPGEEVTVTAPHYNFEQTRLNSTFGRVSLSVPVRYDDLNLRTRHGARQLRVRVTSAARDVCTNLASVYPVYQLNGTQCYKAALENAMLRADEAIDTARSYND